MKRLFLILFGLLVVAVSIVAILNYRAVSDAATKAGFNRLIRNNVVKEEKIISLKDMAYYIPGVTDSRIYLTSLFQPNRIVTMNIETWDTVSNEVFLDDLNDKIIWKHAEYYIDSPQLYLIERKTKSILVSDIDKMRAERIHLSRSFNFLRGFPINKHTFLATIFRNSTSDFQIAKITTDSATFRISSNPFEISTDAALVNIGHLSYNKYTSTVSYLFRYSNEFLLMDTNLVVRLRRRTIDSSSNQVIKTTYLASSKSTTFKKIPKATNPRSFSYKDKLFVLSMARADNEVEDVENRQTSIDAYSLVDGKYLFSFYLPAKDFQDVKMNDRYIFAVEKNNLHVYRYKGIFLDNNFISEK